MCALAEKDGHNTLAALLRVTICCRKSCIGSKSRPYLADIENRSNLAEPSTARAPKAEKLALHVPSSEIITAPSQAAKCGGANGKAKRTGLQRLFAVSGALGSPREWMQRLKSARSHIDLLGYTLHVWTKGEKFEQEMISLVRAGVHARVLIMDDANSNLPSFVNERQISSISVAAVRTEIEAAKKAFKFIADATTNWAFAIRGFKISCFGLSASKH